ncbi:hypothetical protein JL720_8097 [Aureococcus anophagefferens]|nr:hypothetical protein JL720_8097 [Aureococcus anophagefferens]
MCLGATAKTGTPPRAVLFDFDGSLAQSEEAHRKRFVAACGVECDVDRWMDHCVGHSTEWIVDYLTGACEPAVLADLRARATSEAFFADVALTAGARELLEALGDAGVPCAIVSSGLRAYIEGCLARWGLEVAFVVAGDDAEPAEHKPRAGAGIPCVALRNPANAGRGDLLGRCTVADDLRDRTPFLA